MVAIFSNRGFLLGIRIENGLYSEHGGRKLNSSGGATHVSQLADPTDFVTGI